MVFTTKKRLNRKIINNILQILIFFSATFVIDNSIYNDIKAIINA